MNVYLISYDLSSPDTVAHYAPLIKFIKSHGTWAKPLLSVWIVKTSKSVSELRNELREFLLPSDKILVIDITSKSWASLINLGPEVIQWMKNNVSS